MRPEAVATLTDILTRAGRCIASAAGEAWAVISGELVSPAAPADASDDEGLTVAEAAAELNVEQWRVYDMVRRGVLPHYRPSPRTIRIRRGAVKEFVRAGKCTRVEEKRGAKAKPLRLVKP
jgi:excisionase family DNA binding protein